MFQKPANVRRAEAAVREKLQEVHDRDANAPTFVDPPDELDETPQQRHANAVDAVGAMLEEQRELAEAEDNSDDEAANDEPEPLSENDDGEGDEVF